MLKFLKPVLKKSLIFLFIILFSGFTYFYSFKSFETVAADGAPYTVTCNPGQDSSKMMNISFHTDLNTLGGMVMYTKKSDITWENMKIEYASAEISTVFDGMYSKSADNIDFYEDAKFINWSATLKNLEPDTDYMYKVGAGVMSDVKYFRTAGVNDFSFAWISDFHAYLRLPARLKSAMSMIDTLIKYDPETDFILSTGDDVAWGGSYSFWKDFYEQKNVANYMWATTIGNHDYMDRTSSKSTTEFYRVTHNNPTNGYEGEVGVSYWFIYSNTLFFFLDNETLSKGATEVTKCIEWMRKTIKENPTQYIIVSEHYQWFNGISGATNTSYTRFKDFFDEVGVDLALAGNNHIYLRTKPLYKGQVSTDLMLGTVYIQAPSSDNERGQAMNTQLSYNQDLIAYRFTEGGKTVGGSNVKIDENKITVTLLDRNGNILDNVIIPAKRSAFDMSGFDRQEFTDNLTITSSKYMPSDLIVNIDPQALTYVSSIQILDRNGKEIQTIVINDENSLRTILSGYELNKVHFLNAKVIYKDKSSEIKNFRVSTYEEVSIVDFSMEVAEGKVNLNWATSKDVVTKYNFKIDGSLYMNLTKGEISVPLRAASSGLMTIEAVTSDNQIVCTKTISYRQYGDVNLDGKVDVADVSEIQKIILGMYGTNSPYLGNVNFDEDLDLVDATLLMMYIKQKIANFNLPEYKVTFVFEDYEETITVKEGEIPVPPKTDSVDFIGFDKVLQEIYTDTTYVAQYEKTATRVVVTGSSNARVGDAITYNVIVRPTNVTQGVIWTTSDASIATVSENGTVEFKKSGTVQIKATSVTSENIFGVINVTVGESLESGEES